MTTTVYPAKYSYTGEAATEYDARRARNPKWQREQQAVEQLIELFPAGSTLLDVPLGTGRYLPVYQKYGIKTVGGDISLDMLRQARFQHTTTTNLTSCLQADIEHLPLAKDSVDYVVCTRLLNWVPATVLASAIAEFTRVTRHGMIVEIRLHETISVLKALANMGQEMRKRPKLSVRDIRKMLGQRGVSAGYVLHDEQFVLSAFAENGLKVVSAVLVDARTNYRIRDFQPYYMYYLIHA